MLFKRMLAALTLAAPLTAATLNGRITLVSSQDPNVRKHLDYSGVVIWLDPISTPARMIVPTSTRHVTMLQKNKRFTPHILAIRTGTTVDFPNYDPIFHNAFSNYDGQLFDVGLYPPGTTRSVLFRREGIVRVFCNIHPSMSAVIVVLKTDYFTVSDRTGSFQIANVPPGDYRLNIFHERATDQTLTALERTISLNAGDINLQPIAISESGYLPLPHKNKYGHDYPPDAGSGAYPGTRE